ncbi:MAG TPA: hypothetical protein VIZ30_09830 [Pseudomonadales bacterium]
MSSPMLDLIALPVRTPGWIVLLAFAVGGSITLFLASTFPTGYEIVAFGLMSGLAFVLAGVLQCYARHLFESAANGHTMPPTAAPEALNPLSVVIACVLIVLWSSASLLRAAVTTNDPLVWCIATIAIAIAPASAAITMLGDSAADGLDPRSIVRFVRGLGPAYPMLCATTWLGYGSILVTAWYCERAVTMFLLLAGYVHLLAQYLSGRIVFARRNQLVLRTQHSPEQDAAADAAEQDAQLKTLLVELHRLCSVDRYREAFARLDAYLARDRYRNDAHVYRALRDFQGRPLALEHACHYIERLIQDQKSLRAWDVCKNCLADDPLFRPLSDSSALALAALAGHADAHHAATLLRDFARAYPHSAERASAVFRLARIEIEHLGDHAAGIARLKSIRDQQPEFARSSVFQDYIRRFDDLGS